MTDLEIIKLISSYRIPYSTERICQEALDNILPKDITARHKRLDEKNIPDFMIGGTAIEVKIKGSPMSIYKQCVRYLKFDEVKSLILVTGKTMGMPQEILGKPVYVISLGRLWI